MCSPPGWLISLFESHIRNDIPFWCCCNAKDFQRIFRLQIRWRERSVICFGWVWSVIWAQCRYYKNFKILTLPSLIILETVCLMHNHRFTFPEGPRPNSSQNSSHLSALIKKSIIDNAKKLYFTTIIFHSSEIYPLLQSFGQKQNHTYWKDLFIP